MTSSGDESSYSRSTSMSEFLISRDLNLKSFFEAPFPFAAHTGSELFDK
jgi:hypothetical protein